MLKKTGPGKVAESSAVPAGGVRAALYNFDVDGAEAKEEHKAFLIQRVVPVMTGKDARCWLQGSASQSGTDAHNMELSRQRVNNVVAYLVAHGVDAGRLVPSFIGESQANMTVKEADGDRAVTLLAAPVGKQKVPPTPPPKPERKQTTRFRIRELGGLSAGAGPVAVEQIYFQIWDFTNQVTTFYQYTSAGVGKGVKGGPPLSVTLEGPWNDFVTTGSLGSDEFDGPARFTTAGAMWWTKNIVNFMGLPRSIKTDPNPLEISTGFTVGLGASTSVGAMIEGPTYPFKGP